MKLWLYQRMVNYPIGETSLHEMFSYDFSFPNLPLLVTKEGMEEEEESW